MTEITIAHHFYRNSIPSGENNVVRREFDSSKGIFAVNPLFFHTDSLSFVEKMKMFGHLACAKGCDALVSEHLKRNKCRIFHAHNVWPSMTYSSFVVAKDHGAFTIQTLHNFRLFASRDRFFGIDGTRYPESDDDTTHLRRMPPVYSGVLQNHLYSHAIEKSWKSKLVVNYIDKFICLTRFQKNIAISAGIPPKKIVIKPNFLDYDRDPGTEPGCYALYIGRLSAEKGIDFLLDAWKSMPFPLIVIGSGALANHCNGRENVRFLGLLSHAQTLEMLTRARFLVMTSTWYEGFPLVLIESLACGTPCLVPSLGGLPEIIISEITGLLFQAEDAIDFRRQCLRLWDLAPSFRHHCRQEFEHRYTRKMHEAAIMEIYDSAL
jgi:glycosyltransferase involved in cell wall biosynthesis